MKKIYVYTKEDLNNLHYLKDNEYLIVLCNNLDLTDYHIEPINFINTNVIFDGNFHSITNLNISLPNNDNVGLFNTFGDSVMAIKDLELTGNVEGRENVGLVGGVFNGVINNSYFSGFSQGFNNVGGIIGKSTMRLTLNDCVFEMENPLCCLNIDNKNVGYLTGFSNKLLVTSCTYPVKCDNLSGNYNEVKIKPKKVRKRVK